ncbi:hypothetical protein EV363DRAFT_1395304 [Boletus edulis]|nr:hypothetical protein EV363DRAFT_1395304 [Boletus edulis]
MTRSCSHPPRKRLAPYKHPRRSDQRTLTQLHFALDSSVLKTCSLCSLSYTKGAPDDETLHRSHCGRVQRGMEWGKDEEREALKASVHEVAASLKLRDGTKGRIVCFPATVGGKIGTKLAHLLDTINLALASPPLTESTLKSSKAYIFLLPAPSNSHREKIVGCIIAQRISTAMAIATPQVTTPAQTHSLVAVDASSGLFCHPSPLPTPLGITRLFLLSAAAATFIHACPLDPTKGQVAFTQPTEGGCAVMEKWGKGFVRIYEE